MSKYNPLSVYRPNHFPDFEDQVVSITEERHHTGGKHITLEFRNGYGASVVDSYGSHGIELAILDRGEITYDTWLTDDVFGWLDEATLYETLSAISKLERKSEWRILNWVRSIAKSLTGPIRGAFRQVQK